MMNSVSRKTRLVIFDNDGVLMDSEALIKDALVQVYNEMGAPVTVPWTYANIQGRRLTDCLTVAEAQFGVKLDPEAFRSRYEVVLEETFRGKLQPTPHAREMLAKLRAAGIQACVATSGSLAETAMKFQMTGFDAEFGPTSIFSGEQVPHGKPAPDLMLFAAKNMGFKPQHCTVVEDSPFGIQSGHAAGMATIGYTGGRHYRRIEHEKLDLSPFYASGAQVVIEDHRVLLSILP
jgi:HAD superfamily hydrolase (TIGR01509 family)